MHRLCAAAVGSVFVVACGASPVSPTVPVAAPLASTADTAPFPPPAPPGTTRGLVGRVTGVGNVPVVGARVVVLAVGWYGGTTTEASVVTDGEGVYSMPVVKAYAGGDAVGWLLVGASKPGYFADFKWWLDFPKDADLDLRLEPL